MSGHRLILASLALSALLTASAAAHFSADLTPLPAQEADQPFRPARLAIHNDTNREIRWVRLRWQHGGPAVVYPLTIAPEAEVVLTVRLPAVATTQTYDLIASAGGTDDAPDIVIAVTIVWPDEIVNAGGLIASDIYDRLTPAGSVWSGASRRRILLIAVAAALVLAGATLIREGRTRTILIIAAVIVCVGAVAIWTQSHVVVDERLSNDGRYIILHSRRTVTWRTDRTDLIPIYAGRRHLMEDTTVIDSDGITLTLPAGQLQLLQRPSPAHE